MLVDAKKILKRGNYIISQIRELLLKRLKMESCFGVEAMLPIKRLGEMQRLCFFCARKIRADTRREWSLEVHG